MNTDTIEYNINTMINDLVEDLNLIKNELTIQNEEIIKLREQTFEKEKKIKELKQKKTNIIMKIEQIKIKSHPDILKIKKLFNENELNIIINGMDKTDYNEECSCNKYPRFLDLEKITDKVKELKKYYPDWTLTNVSTEMTQDSLPPRTSYSYEFIDSHGIYFKLY